MAEKSGEVVWIDRLRFLGQAGSGHSIVFDVPSAESPAGMSPMEAALLAMAGCTAVDIVEIMRKKRQNLIGLRVRISGQQAPEPPNVYTDIAVEYILTGRNLSEAAVKHAIELSETKYCSVGAMLSKTARVHSTYRIIEAE
ncbi:MAG: OsmC family protein [Chloroflexi bacterium]|nr:OsmC family protein [Chloroflexota bacterium]